MADNQYKKQSMLYKTSKQKGNWAEDLACKWLVKQGLNIKAEEFLYEVW
jgi:hypothetical protein